MSEPDHICANCGCVRSMHSKDGDCPVQRTTWKLAVKPTKEQLDELYGKS